MRGAIGVMAALTLAVSALAPMPAMAQFSSGSTGALGAFPPATANTAAGTVPSGTTGIAVDLRTGIVTFAPGNQTAQLGPAGVGFADGVLHFTTINVPQNVIVTFNRNDGNTPVTMLAPGDVNVAGRIDVSGQDGEALKPGSARGGVGGPGGFKGGNGETFSDNAKAGDGLGPGGGAGGFFSPSTGFPGGAGAGYAFRGATSSGNAGGNTYGTPALLPLVGGSGGGGGTATVSSTSAGGNGGGGGGGGGGAILIASSGTITMAGSITANGGNGGSGAGGGGSGGAIRLVANTITGAGTLGTAGGAGGGGIGNVSNSGGGGSNGRVRLEAFAGLPFAGTITGSSSSGAPGFVFLPNTPTLKIVAIDNQALAEPFRGQFGGADAIVTPGTHTITVQAANVPANTTVTVTAKPDTDAANPASATTTALTGSPPSATATLSFAVGGLYFIEARANFTLP